MSRPGEYVADQPKKLSIPTICRPLKHNIVLVSVTNVGVPTASTSLDTTVSERVHCITSKNRAVICRMNCCTRITTKTVANTWQRKDKFWIWASSDLWWILFKTQKRLKNRGTFILTLSRWEWELCYVFRFLQRFLPVQMVVCIFALFFFCSAA